MSRQLAKLINAHRDLADRYGPDDPLVDQLRRDIERLRTEANLPFEERRKVKLSPALWGRQPRRMPGARTVHATP